jgi:hypothetical protein
MFSNIAKFRAAPAASRPRLPTHSNDNARIARPVLSCHWQPAPGGKLECRWEAERANTTAAEEPEPRWPAAGEPCGVADAA